MDGHGFIISMTTYLSYIFEFNPQEVSSSKSVSYFYAPNIGSSSKQAFYTGAENEAISFTLEIYDMESPFGVIDDISFFRQLREPAPELSNILDTAGSYPPAKVLFFYGTGTVVPGIYIVENIDITTKLFKGGEVQGTLGIPKGCNIDITLRLDEDNIFNRANKLAIRAGSILGSQKSITREAASYKGGRREQPGFFSPNVKF